MPVMKKEESVLTEDSSDTTATDVDENGYSFLALVVIKIRVNFRFSFFKGRKTLKS